MSHTASECLEGQIWTSGNWFNRKVHFKGRNLCHDLGKVVAKVDLSIVADRNWTFPYGHTAWKEGSIAGGASVRGLYCCTDVSDLCNPEDLVTPASCGDRWAESQADSVCTDETFEVVNDGRDCRIRATCTGNGLTITPTMTTHYHQVYKLGICAFIGAIFPCSR